MLCDIEDWHDLKEYYWKDNHGYAVAVSDYKYIRFGDFSVFRSRAQVCKKFNSSI